MGMKNCLSLSINHFFLAIELKFLSTQVKVSACSCLVWFPLQSSGNLMPMEWPRKTLSPFFFLGQSFSLLGEVTWEENLKRGAVLVDKADLFWVSKVVPSLQLEFGDLASFEKNKDLLLDVIKAGLVEDLLRDGDKGEFWTPVPVPLLGRRADSSADEATRAKYAKQRELRAKLFQAARNILHRVKTSCFAEEIEAAKRAREEIEAAAAAVGESPEVGDLTSSEPHLPGIFFDDGMEVLLTPETVRGISLQGRVLFVFLPDEKIRQAKKMAQYWNTLPCAKIDPLTQAAVYGEYTIPTLARVWFTTEKGVVLDKNDGTVDWGAGAGKILLSPTFLSPFPQVHRLGVEMDAAAYKLLVQNVSHFKRWHRVEMKGAAGALTVEGSQAPVPPLPTRAVAAASSSSAASSSASRAGVSFPVQVAAPAPLRIDTLNCDSSEIHSWGGGGATIFMQYDGGPQASEFLRAKCQPWITIVRCCMSNPESKVFFSTKLNQNAYDNVINTPDVNLGR